MRLRKVPNLVYSDGKGNIYDVPEIEMAGRTGVDFVKIDVTDLIELPEGSQLFELPGRRPVGFDRKTGRKIVFKDGIAVAAFLAPAYTQFFLSAYERDKDSVPILPLFHQSFNFIYCFRCIGRKDNAPSFSDKNIILDSNTDIPIFRITL